MLNTQNYDNTLSGDVYARIRSTLEYVEHIIENPDLDDLKLADSQLASLASWSHMEFERMKKEGLFDGDDDRLFSGATIDGDDIDLAFTIDRETGEVDCTVYRCRQVGKSDPHNVQTDTRKSLHFWTAKK